MSCEQDGLTKLPKVVDQTPGLAPGGRVEACRGLVKKHHVGITNDAQRQFETALLAPAEAFDPSPSFVLQADDSDHLIDRTRLGVDGGIGFQHLRDF